jgi:hypothetical protein
MGDMEACEGAIFVDKYGVVHKMPWFYIIMVCRDYGTEPCYWGA